MTAYYYTIGIYLALMGIAKGYMAWSGARDKKAHLLLQDQKKIRTSNETIESILQYSREQDNLNEFKKKYKDISLN